MRADGRLFLLPFFVLGAAQCRRESVRETKVAAALELRSASLEIRPESTSHARSDAHGVRLDRGRVRVPLEAPDLAPGRRVHLTMRDCMTDVPPGINYQVFLGEPTSEHYVGGITFFDAVHRRVTDRLGDVTEIAERLAAEGGPWEVTIVPLGVASPAAHPVVGDVLLVSR